MSHLQNSLSRQFSRISGSVWLKLESVIVFYLSFADDQISDIGSDKLFTKGLCNFPGYLTKTGYYHCFRPQLGR
jgi:hypothetical protein